MAAAASAWRARQPLLNSGKLGFKVAPALHLPGPTAFDGSNRRTDSRMRRETAVSHEAEPSRSDNGEEKEGALREEHEQGDWQHVLGEIEDRADHVSHLGRVAHCHGEPGCARRCDGQ